MDIVYLILLIFGGASLQHLFNWLYRRSIKEENGNLIIPLTLVFIASLGMIGGALLWAIVKF